MRCFLTLAAGFLLAGLLVLPGLARAQGNWYVEPTVGITASTRLHEPDHMTGQATFAALKTEYHDRQFRVLFDGEYRYDSVYDLQDNYSQEAEDAYRFDGTVHRALAGWQWSGWDLSLGYQKVAWGEADDLRVVDVVNPLDYRDFVLFDLNDYRIAQNMFRIEGALGDAWDVEALWIFRFQGNDYPPPGSEFSSPLMPQAPEDEPEGSEFGIRATSMLGGADISLYGFRGYEDAPVYVLEDQQLVAHHSRMGMVGLSFNTPVSSWVIRGDAACFPNRSLGRDDGTTSRHTMTSALLATDYLFRDWIFGIQVMDRYIEGWTRELIDERSDAYVTASAEGTTFEGKLTTRIAFTRSTASGHGGLSQLKLTYRPDRHWAYSFALDVMDGDNLNVFGQFNGRDRIWISTSYTF